MAAQIAKIDGLNVQLFVSVVKCESDFDNMAVGDNGTSFGIAQIHLPAHPEITKEEAYNPQWALNWMGRQWQAGNERAWSCYRILTK